MAHIRGSSLADAFISDVEFTLATPSTANIGGTQFVYTSNNGRPERAIRVFSVNNDGSLNFLTALEDTAETALRGAWEMETFVIGGTTFLAAVGQEDDGISVFSLTDQAPYLTHVDSVFDTEDTQYELDGVRYLSVHQIEGNTFLTTTSRPFLGNNTTFDTGITVFQVANDGTLSHASTFDQQDIDDSGSGSIASGWPSDTFEVNGSYYFAVGDPFGQYFSIMEIDSQTGELSVAVGTAGLGKRSTQIAVQTVGTKPYLFVPSDRADDSTLYVYTYDGGADVELVTSITLEIPNDDFRAEVTQVYETGDNLMVVIGARGKTAGILTFDFNVATETLSQIEWLPGPASEQPEIHPLQDTSWSDGFTIDGVSYALATSDDTGTTNIYEIGGGYDNLVGTDDDDLIEGFGGGDTLTGLAGDDTIFGGDGVDTAGYKGTFDEYQITDNGSGSFTVFSDRVGDAGTDELFEIERIRFADGNYTAEDGFTLGGGGDDVITGTPVGDNLIGTSDNDLIEGIGGDDTLTGLAGDDSISGGFGIDTAIYEGNFDEYSVTENGGSAYTIVSTRAGDAGTDELFDIERIQFADGTLTAAGFVSGVPTITTPDTAEVDEGLLFVADVETDDDTASESNGLLSYSISAAPDSNAFEIDEDTGVVSFLTAPDFETPTDANGDNVYQVSIQVSDGLNTDTLDLSVTVQDVDESQTITTDEDGGTTNGSDEGDTIIGLSGDDVINAGLGNDTVVDQGGDNTVNAGGGADRVGLISGTNEAFGDSGNDLIIGGYDNDELNGGSGDDVIVGDLSTFVAGADRIEGGTGNDLLEGRGGADTFVFSTGDGDDTIGALNLDMSDPSNTAVTGADFQSGIDMILLEGFGYDDGAEAFSNVSNVGGVATFDDEGTSITFAGLSVADLSSDDFSV